MADPCQNDRRRTIISRPAGDTMSPNAHVDEPAGQPRFSPHILQARGGNSTLVTRSRVEGLWPSRGSPGVALSDSDDRPSTVPPWPGATGADLRGGTSLATGASTSLT